MNEEEGGDIERMKSNKKTILIVLLCIILALMGVGIGIKIAGNSNNAAGGGVGLTIDKNAGEYVAPEVDTTPTQGVAIPGWGSLTIPPNTKKVTVDFMNPIQNEGLYYLTFELRLLNGNDYEVLYTSGLVEPGLHIQSIELSRGLPAGEYDAVVHVQPYRMDEAKTPTNNADMELNLIVK